MIKVLAIDDDRAYLKLVCEVLSDDPLIEVNFCWDSREAFDLCLRTKPTVILLDVNMPHVDGIALRQMLSDNPETKLIPVIFITADGKDPITVDDVFRVGCFELLPKPINADQLRETIRENRIQNLFNSISEQIGALHVLANASTIADHVSH